MAPSTGNAQGIDISDVNFPSTGSATEPTWSTLKNNSGISFVSIKATEGDYYTDEPSPPYSDGSKFVGYQAATEAATAAGLYVMPYVFGNPHTGNGSPQCQADYAWQEINSTTSAYDSSSLMLPVALDIEQDPYASSTVNACYNQTTSGMVTWITNFLAELKADETKQGSFKTPVIYTNPTFWSQCVGNSTAFTSDLFWLADYGVSSPPAVAGWSSPTFWQYTDAATVTGQSGSVDGNYVAPLQQNSTVGTPVKPVQVRSLSALNGQAVTYSAPAGGLPPGLTISSTGLITGTPKAAGSYQVSITAAASAGSSTVSFVWNIAGAITMAPQASQSMAVGTPASLSISATDSNVGLSGYTSPALTASGLPPGLSFAASGTSTSSATASAQITGWPSTAGTYKVTITAKDGLDATATATFTWTVKVAADSGMTGPIHQQGGSNKCLDDPSSRTTSGWAIDLATCTGKSNQSWTVVPDGSIRVLGQCLAASGTRALLYPCDGSIADQWRTGTDGSLVDVRYGTCLNGPSGAAANGTKPTLATCTNSTSKVNQHWAGPLESIVSGVAAKCVAASGVGAASAAELNNCGNYSAEHWLVAANAQIVVQSSNCLTEGGTTANSAITITKCANYASQHWKLVAAVGAIAAEIQSTASGLCVTVPSGATANGTHLVLGTCSTALASTWHVP
jgi:GH25 family lysozyme M1 (1,4-beta-N-acetylmuramidase)